MCTKLAVVDRLRQDMRAHCQQAAGDAASHAWVQGTYEIFCDAFKTYLLSYDGATDVRFFPTAAVPADSVLVKQGSSHWKARWGGERRLVCETCSGDQLGSYQDMAKAPPKREYDEATRTQAPRNNLLLP